MSLSKSKCDGCGEIGQAKQCFIPGRGESVQLCVYGGGPKRHLLKMECYARLFETKCILCGNEHDRELSYTSNPGAGLYSIHSFSPLCNACIIHARLGKTEAQRKEQAWLGNSALLKDPQLTSLFAKVLGNTGLEYVSSGRIGSGNSAHGLNITPEQKEALTSFVEKLQEHVDDAVRRAVSD